MNRRSDVEEVLATVKKQHEVIKRGYDKALHDQSLKLRVPVKNLMENLRSVLDYMARDIYETCCRTARLASGRPDPDKIYFPYGRNEADFKSGVGRSLPGLATLAPNIYKLIASIQPFRCDDDWLYDLCKITNENKHDRLTPQVRDETETYTVSGGKGSVTIPVNNPQVGVKSKPIARIGYDGKVATCSLQLSQLSLFGKGKAKPHELRVTNGIEVPGAHAPVTNAFHVSQILSWIAKECGTIQAQLELMMQIPNLMDSLLSGRHN